MKVDRYVEPSEFDRWKEIAEGMGFLYVASGPLVRSSYKVSLSPYSHVRNNLILDQAGELYIENILRGKAADKDRARLIKDQLAVEGSPVDALAASG
jgi:lipoic acid synthetase